MGLISGIAVLSGRTEPKNPDTNKTIGDYTRLLEGYNASDQQAFNAAQEFAPKWASMYADTAAGAMPGIARTVRASNPGLTTLLDKILASASGEGASLDYGSPLPPKIQELQAQQSRAGQAARGLGFGPSDVLGETRDATKLSMDLTDRNRAFASNAAGLGYQTQSAPILAFLQAIMGASGGQLTTPAQRLQLLLAPYEARLKTSLQNSMNETQAAGNADAAMTSLFSMGG